MWCPVPRRIHDGGRLLVAYIRLAFFGFLVAAAHIESPCCIVHHSLKSKLDARVRSSFLKIDAVVVKAVSDMEDQFPAAASRGHHRDFQGARKILQRSPKGELSPTLPSPGPSQVCRDTKSGAVVSCNNPSTAVIIIAGMACMLFLVTIALMLLFYSFVKHRQRRREERNSAIYMARGPGSDTSNRGAMPAGTGAYDSAVLVQLPGDEKPRFFALPVPFVDQNKDTEETGGGHEENNSVPADGMEDTHGARVECTHPQPADDEIPCVPSTDGSYRNPLFLPG